MAMASPKRVKAPISMVADNNNEIEIHRAKTTTAAKAAVSRNLNGSPRGSTMINRRKTIVVT